MPSQTHNSTSNDPAAIQIAVINASTVLSDNDVKQVIDPLQQQVTNDFRPAWGIDATLTFFSQNTQPPAGSWWLVVLDDSDQAGALGYHDLTTEGLPLGKVFAGTDLKYGNQWTVTASHELLEMLADPDINLTVFSQTDNNTGRLYAYEVCDAVEADELGYKIAGTLVSDFVYPSWFQDFRAEGSTRFDHEDHVKKPFELAKGGYIGVFDIQAGSGWHQITARQPNLQMRANVGSRRERRRILRSHWLKSLPLTEIRRNMTTYHERLARLRRGPMAA